MPIIFYASLRWICTVSVIYTHVDVRENLESNLRALTLRFPIFSAAVFFLKKFTYVYRTKTHIEIANFFESVCVYATIQPMAFLDFFT